VPSYSSARGAPGAWIRFWKRRGSGVVRDVSDATSGKETYGAGRFLYVGLPNADRIEVDFNEAFNPPCAFTDFATCPLPPPQNRLAWPSMRASSNTSARIRSHRGRRSNTARVHKGGPTVDRAREDIKATIGLVRVEGVMEAASACPMASSGAWKACCCVLQTAAINSQIKCGRGDRI